MLINHSYNPAICDLCGSNDYSALVDLNTHRSMRSDCKIIDSNLSKFLCKHCELVRDGQFFDDRQLRDYYGDEYTSSEHHTEHYFYTTQKQVSRSTMFCDWLITAMGTQHWERANRCLEIGAGSGLLMQEFISRFPEKTFEGIELSEMSVSLAKQRGIAVSQSCIQDLDMATYDIIYSVAVLEHVPSPTQFLCEVRKRLRPSGLLYLAQPTQDVPSYDLFFADHLHHFGSEHLRQYARKCGWRELGLVVGHEWMPNFSLHLWQANDEIGDFSWFGPPGFTTCGPTAKDILTVMTNLDGTLARLAAEKRRVAVFGLNEVYWLARAYSTLGDFPIVCGLDDSPNKLEISRLGFPLTVPEECLAFDIQDVILTMNKVYYPAARRRLESLGLTVHDLWH